MTVAAACGLRIVHIASGDLWAGAEAQILGLVKVQQERQGHHVHAILLNEGPLAARLRSADIEVTILPEAELGPLALLTRIRRRLREIRADVVHTHRQNENVLGAIANQVAGRAICVRTVHGSAEHSGTRQGLQARIDRWVGRWLQDAIVAVSTTLATELNSRYRPGQVHTIQNGIEVPEVVPASASLPEAPTQTGLGSEPNRIAFVGRLVPVKRLDLLMDAFDLLPEAIGARTELHVIGDGPLRAWLEARVQASPRSPQIYLHGHVGTPHELMNRMHCIVLCSDHEGTPMTMLEAMAHRVPLVVHRVGGMQEALEPDCAMLVDEHAPAGYAEAVSTLLGNPHFQKELTERAARRLQQRYSVTACADAYEALYRSVLEPRTRMARQ